MQTRYSIPVLAGWFAFLLHVAGNPRYGFFRDELYFIMCGFRPDFGYVDQPPLVPLMAAASQLFGPSLFLIRAIAAVFAGLSIFITGQLTRELGGGRFAQFLACLVTFFCPVLMAFGMKVGTDMVGLWTWPLLLLLVIRIVNGAHPRNWIYAGLVLGLSFQAKYSVLFLALALLGGLLASSQRRLLLSRWCWAGIGTAVLIAIPNAIWQARHGLPMLELLRRGQAGKNVVLAPWEYMASQLLLTNPLLSIFWMLGLVWLIRRRSYRFIAFTFLLLMLFMSILHAKNYYPANIYPIMIAAGAIAWDKVCRSRISLRLGTVVYSLLAGALLVPYVMPILPIPQFLAYDTVLFNSSSSRLAKTENHANSKLRQDWADMHGWPELAATVRQVVDSLTPAERKEAVIVAENYGEAAAIEFFGRGHDLPPVISGHNQYFLWGTRGASGNILIDLNGDCGRSLQLFQTTILAAKFQHPYVMPYENNIEIWICKGINRPLSEIWPMVKLYL